jgi:hypothetical protein
MKILIDRSAIEQVSNFRYLGCDFNSTFSKALRIKLIYFKLLVLPLEELNERYTRK